MEIKIGDRVFQLPDSCPTDPPKKRRLVRHLRDHGPESLLTSKILAPYSQCILDEILEAGGEPVQRVDETAAVSSSDENRAEASNE